MISIKRTVYRILTILVLMNVVLVFNPAWAANDPETALDDYVNKDRPVWTHWLAMIVPAGMTKETGMLIIAGGSNTPIPDLDSDEVAVGAQIAINSGTVVSVIGQIPNQPLFFMDEPFAHSHNVRPWYFSQ